MTRAISVAVAIVHDKEGRFLLSYNDRWRAYTFPMRKPTPGEKLPDVAVQAFQDHGPPASPRIIRPLSVIPANGPSFGEGETTYYRYHAYEIDPGRPLPLVDPNSAYYFLALQDLLDAPNVSWSAKEIARALADPSFIQESAVAIVCRRGPKGREFLVVQNAGYDGFFFPAARLRFEEPAAITAEQALRDDSDYDGPLKVTRQTEAELQQLSERYGVNQIYRFHLCKVAVTGVDLRTPGNGLEAALTAYGMPYRWAHESEFDDPTAHGLTATVGELKQHVLALAGECE